MRQEALRLVITGVTRGIGRALALEAARAGHRVLGCGRDAKALASLARELGAGHDVAAVDVTDAAAVERWAERLVLAHGAPDRVVNNAALINRTAPLWQVPVAEMSALIDVNVKGVFHVIRAFLPAMIARGAGVVVNLSSGWGRSTSPEVAPYCASKYAVEGMTAALAQELPPGLAAVALNPGVIDTDMLRTCWAEQAAAYEKPANWARRALPFLLRLGPRDNGRALTVPGSATD